MKPEVAVIIPARYKSSRFPGKPLVMLKGIPMVVRVARICEIVVGRELVFVATDSVEISDVVKQHGFKSVMTSERHPTGTDRVAEAATSISAEIYVNVQGDEPLIQPDDISKVIETKARFPEYVVNGMTEFDVSTDSVNIPKVVTTEDNDLLYISRSLIPGSKSKVEGLKYYKQVCIYAFSLAELKAFHALGRKSTTERIEDIEILRFFEFGKKIKMVPVSGGSIAVDVPEDVELVNARLN